MKLISMTDFVLELETNEHWAQDYTKCVKYANFLKQPLTLGMFVPCDEDGNFLEEPKEKNYSKENNLFAYDLFEYQQAKERVLFEGFEVKTKTAFNNGYNFICDNIEIFYPFWYNPVTKWELSKGLKTVKDLIIFQPKLTETAIKQIKK